MDETSRKKTSDGPSSSEQSTLTPPTNAPDLFTLRVKLQIPTQLKDSLDEIMAKYSLGHLNYFALTLKRSNDLILLCDGGKSRPSLVNVIPTAPSYETGRKWTLRHIPWFEDPTYRISALSFDEDGLLYIGTSNGIIYELNAAAILNLPHDPEIDLKPIFRFDELKISDILIWFKETCKTVMCNGGNGKFVIISCDALPVVVTFKSSVIGMDLFVNNAGLSCALVCLESGTNLYTILNDLELPLQEDNFVRKSIFKRAKDNIISRFGSDGFGDRPIFGRKVSKDVTLSATSITSMESVSAIPVGTIGGIAGATSLTQKFTPVTNIKFSSLEDTHSNGLLRKVMGKSQFFRHVATKLDFFDSDFRQTSSVFVPSYIKKLYLIQKIYYGIDEDNQCVRIMMLHAGTMKEFATLPFAAKIYSIEAVGELENTPYSVFIVAENGIFEMCLKRKPLDTCVDLLLNESSTSLDVVCAALNVPKAEAYIVTGDKHSDDGKFAKTIIYYKLAGMTYAKIMAKFGSRGLIPAMLCFHELTEQERSKLAGNLRDRCLMADVAILGRIEQYLRLGHKSNAPRDPKLLLEKILTSNIYYSTKTITMSLCYPELMWALSIVGRRRMAYSEILGGLHENRSLLDNHIVNSKAFWKFLNADWLAVYSAPRLTFHWFRDIVMNNLTKFERDTLYKTALTLVPWRRDLHRKLFNDSPDLTEIIDFTGTTESNKVGVGDYFLIFFAVILEILKRNEEVKCNLSSFQTPHQSSVRRSSPEKSGGRNSPEKSAGRSSPEKSAVPSPKPNLNSLSASPSQCSCIRNGKVYNWGENRYGRLGIHESRERSRTIVDAPMPLNLPASLRITIDSVSTGHGHSLALTSYGTILVWGSNAYGQLGVGRQAMWSGRPVALNLPQVFISISAGAYHSVALDNTYKVWTWGWGIFGQLGYGGIENKFHPCQLKLKEKITTISAGHSHTGLTTTTGLVLTFGCSHFGQLGHGDPNVKVKIPKIVATLPHGVIAHSIKCGTCSTVVLTGKNQLYYFGLNPSSLKSLLTSSRRRADPKVPPTDTSEEKDYHSPVLIDTSHLAGDIVKVAVATTHFVVLTSLGLVYTWGLGKSGQLVRPEDDNKTLELIDCDDKMMVASDVACASDCTFIMERETGKLYGCGFNSCGQLGRMESDEEASILTIRTKKRVVKVRQPANIYLRPREIIGLPKLHDHVEKEHIHNVEAISPPHEVVDQNLLEWCLRNYIHYYSPRCVINECLRMGNLAAAVVIEVLIEDHEAVLKHNLARRNDKDHSAESIADYVETVEKKSSTCMEQACHFLAIVVQHWVKNKLPASSLEEILQNYRVKPTWNLLISYAVKDKFASGDDSSKWMATNFTPVFILGCFKDSRDLVPRIQQQQQNNAMQMQLRSSPSRSTPESMDSASIEVNEPQ